MSTNTTSSGFKYLFWGLLILACVAFLGQVVWMMFGGFWPIPYLLGTEPPGAMVMTHAQNLARMGALILPTFLLGLVWVGVVAPLVYRDAKKRGMDPYLWATVAVFIPFFIGIVVYLVVRSNGHMVCGGCGQAVKSEYKICPHCGHRLDSVCPSCGKGVSPDWSVCPYCTHALRPAS